MRLSLLLVAVILAATPLAASATVTYHVHGTAALADNRVPGPVALTMDLVAGSQSQPRIVLAHSAGDTLNANAVTASFVAVEGLRLGDSDPATPDTVSATVCMSQSTQTAFVTRMLVTVLVDGTRVARRLNNDFGMPANAPSCKSFDVTIGMFVDDQTPANTAPLEIALAADGNLEVPAGAKVSYLVDVDTVVGGPVWGYYYDAAAYPTSLKLNLAPSSGAAISDGPVYVNLTSPQLSQTLAKPINGTYIYNFTATEPATFVYRANGTGAATVAVRDANGTVLFNQTLTAPANATVAMTKAVAGNWSYHVQYQAFNGTLFLDLMAPKPATGADTATSSSSSTKASTSAISTAPDNVTGNSTIDGSGKDAPGMAATLLSAGLVAVAVLLRRRRI